MANASFKKSYLHEGVINHRSSKDLTFQFVSVLSNNEVCSAIQASMNSLYSCEVRRTHVQGKK